MQIYQPGEFTYHATNADFAFNGVLYRTIPSYSNEPLTARFSIEGGRWNWPNTNLVFYTYSAFQTAQVAFINSAMNLGVDIANVNPAYQRDLLVLQINANNLADLATDGGLQNFSLPIGYPIGFQQEEAWSITRSIGDRIFASTASGLVTRSASLSQWVGPIQSWAEVALFPDRIAPPVLLDRIEFKDWFYQ
jgi:hypothetical protein